MRITGLGILVIAAVAAAVIVIYQRNTSTGKDTR
jgi:hypothetical protein